MNKSNSQPAKSPPAKSRRRWLGLAALGLALLLAIFVRGRSLQPPSVAVELPEIPEVNLEGADPEIARFVKVARKQVQKLPNTAMAWGEYAMTLDANGFGDAARTCYSSAALLEPKNPLWPYLHGCLDHHAPGGPAAALPNFRLAADQSSPQSMAQVRLADALLDLGRLDEAEKEYRKVLAAKASDELAQLGLAQLAVARQQYDVALRLLEPLSTRVGVRRQASAMKARVHDRLGERDAAAKEREKLEKLPDDGPRGDDPILLLGKYRVGVQMEISRALDYLNERPDQTMGILKAAVRRYPDSYEAWAALGKTCGMLRDFEGAEEAFRRSVQTAPQNPEGWLSLANVLILQKRHREAVDSIQKTLALDPQNGLAYFSLGECRRAAGDRAGAAEAYRQAFRFDPQNQHAKKRLEELGKSP